MVMFWGLKGKGEWGSDKGLCPLGSRDEGSFVAVKLDPPPFLDGVPLSRHTGVESYYIKEPKMDIPPHRKTVLPIKGLVIHDATEFMAAHLELNYVDVSYPFQYFTGAHATGAP